MLTSRPRAARAVRLAVMLIAGTGALAAVLIRLDDRPIWWIELLRFIPYPALLLPLLAALLGAAWSGWQRRGMFIGAALALLLWLVWGMGLSLGTDRAEPPADASRALRLMSYNIKSYHAAQEPDGFARLADEIARQQPDVLVTVDAQELEDDAPPPEMRAALAPLRHTYGYGQYDIFSRLPLRDCMLHEMRYGTHASEYLHCVLLTPAGEVDLVAVHLVSPREGLNAARHQTAGGLAEWRENFGQRLHQVQQLADGLHHLHGHERPLIVAGDLNATEPSPILRPLLASGLRDAWSAGGLGWGFTIGHALRPHISFLRIDHILLSPSIGVSRCAVGGPDASEHRPVIADLVLPAPASGPR